MKNAIPAHCLFRNDVPVKIATSRAKLLAGRKLHRPGSKFRWRAEPVMIVRRKR